MRRLFRIQRIPGVKGGGEIKVGSYAYKADDDKRMIVAKNSDKNC